ncbi:alpha/beta hydrolase [Paractinoplanes lichenicola]|uniref:Alpha/beta fold hydrolase n=1 Tax=Paractinoplanes lichenicola TaxID=2802976 RepID=A0ABS1VQ06_9ACTN|nr:alpha/beta hydrolase [Actinoplanes lichenicola]MBL7255616.1 alpha/beta fold hydrolase [Actinoplanes lichenicola]
MTRFLVFRGRGVPAADHWSREWVGNYPEFTWAPAPPEPPFVVADRLAALHAAISADDEPAILIAHSAGCLVVAVWAAQHTGPVRAALLVTPPYFESGPPPTDGLTGTGYGPWPDGERWARSPSRPAL